MGHIEATTSHGRLTVDRIIEPDLHAVQIDLTALAPDLLTTLARTIRTTRTLGDFAAIGGPDLNDRLDSLHKLRRILDHYGIFHVTITPDAAETLAEDLTAAAVEPDGCARSDCTANAVDTITGLCETHLERASTIPARDIACWEDEDDEPGPFTDEHGIDRTPGTTPTYVGLP